MNTTAGDNEHPLTVAFVEEYSRTVFPVTVIDALMKDLWKTEGFAETRGYDSNDILTFTKMIQVKGRPPSRKAQFCTEILTNFDPKKDGSWKNINSSDYMSDTLAFAGRSRTMRRKYPHCARWDECTSVAT